MKTKNAQRLQDLIKSNDLVLDVGGWHSPLNRADYIIDIMPYASRNKGGAILPRVWPDERFTSSTFLQMDICGPNSWPFADKQFDFVVCSHTLEDVRDPIFVCKELNRVAKAGYIEVPSRLVESTKGVERPFYCGYYHHRWLCEVGENSISFMFKPAMLHAYRKFHFRKPFYQKINPELDAVWFFWQGSFDYREKIIIDRDQVQKDLSDFKTKTAQLGNLFLSKYNWRGRRTDRTL